MRKLLVYLSISFLILSCKYDVESELFNDNPCEIPDTVSFSTEIVPLFNASCAVPSCHVNGNIGGANFEMYEEFVTEVESGTLLDRIKNPGNPMPPSGLMPPCNVELIEAWIDQGYPNN